MKSRVQNSILISSIIFVLILILINIGFIYNSRKSKILKNVENKESKTLNLEENIKFEDENLYNAIIENIKEKIEFKNNDSDLSITLNSTEKDKIKTLTLNNKNISNISGIEYFSSLTNLNISNNTITDISMLNKLTNLTELKANGNSIKDISSIAELTKLEYLNLANNKLEDKENSLKAVVCNLELLVNLKYLDLSHNYIRYTENLQELINLKYLNMYDNAIEDLQGLAKLSDLETLKLGENNENGTKTISNLESIKNLTNLKYLDFSENSTPSIMECLLNLNNLETLSIQKNKISDLSNLEKLTKLKELNLYNNSIKNIDSLVKLENLEVLILGNNNIRTITEIYLNDNIVWTNIKKIDLSGNKYIYTPEKTETIESPRIEQNNNIIQKLKETNIEINYEYLTDTTSLPHIDKNGIRFITYDDFGAKCNGEYDDFIAIRNAHTYANSNNCEVRATEGKTYHIFKYYEKGVIVNTNVNWGNATFIIHDEEIEECSGRYNDLFIVKNITDKETIDKPNWTIGTDTKKINEICETLEKYNSKGYTKYLCVARNNNKKQYIRFGNNANSGNDQREYFIIDNNGNVLNDIQWNFEELTSFEIYAIPNNELSISNGNFISNTINSQSQQCKIAGKPTYFRRSIFMNTVGNINISKIKHTLSNDVICGAYHGFLSFSIGANINISNCELFTRKYSIKSTYDLILDGCVNLICDNVVSNDILDDNRWGITGTNYCKDVTFKNCILNRIDAHCGIYNLNVENCTIGIKALTMTGQGTLNIINTKIMSSYMISLRSDFGSTWNGNINIIDCNFVCKGTGAPRIVSLSIAYEEDGSIHDFGYECKYPNLYIENLTIDYDYNPNYNFVVVIPNFTRIKPENIPGEYWPDKILINGYKFINSTLSDPYIKLTGTNIGNISGNYVITNTKFMLENCSGTEVTNKFEMGEELQTNKDIYFEINENSSAENTISIYKNEEGMVENKLIESKYNYTFNEEGIYKIKLNSKDKIYNRTGEKIYEFKIDRKLPQLSEVKVNFQDADIISENEKKYVNSIKPETTIEELINKIETNGKIEILKDGEEITDNETKISTGMKIKISLNNESSEFTIVVKGDTNGDGECNIKDLLQVNKHRLNKTQLKEEFLIAGDVNKDNEINIKDILQINKFRLGKIKNL